MDDIVDKHVHIHLVAEVGAGKSTLLRLLKAYQEWLHPDIPLFYPFEEDIPHHIWAEYQAAKSSGQPAHVIYEAQKWFMEQKLRLVAQDAGNDSEKKPGFYIVERSPREDFYIFAQGMSHLFNPEDYRSYVDEFGPRVMDSPRPNLIIRLRVSPEISLQRVTRRNTKELLTIGDYYVMQGQYLNLIDPWIAQSRIPTIEIDTTRSMFDFDTDQGQLYFLTTLLSGLHGYGFWKPDTLTLPFGKLIHVNGDCPN